MPASPPQPASSLRLHRGLLALALFVLPAAYLFKLTMLDPTAHFLRPGLHGAWVIHPDREDESFHKIGYRRTIFERRFDASSVPGANAGLGDATLRFVAFGRATVRLNGEELRPATRPATWQQVVEVTLPAAMLRSAGDATCTLTIDVVNGDGFPALRVASPESLVTPAAWVAGTPRYTVPTAVAGPFDLAPRPGTLQRQDAWPVMRVVGVGWFIVVAVMTAWVAAAAIVRRTPVADAAIEVPGYESRHVPRRRSWVVPLLIIAMGLVLSLYNISQTASSNGPDANDHRDHVQWVRDHWTVPPATEGWQMYQPPLYYFAAAAVCKVTGGGATERADTAWKAVQAINAICGTALALITYLTLRAFYPRGGRPVWLALALAVLLPCLLSVEVMVNNELLVAALGAAVVWLLVRMGQTDRRPLAMAALLGVLAGLAMLSRFTGIIALATGAAVLGLRAIGSLERKRAWLALAVYLAVALVVCGWFYARNIHEHGQPFVGNWNVGKFDIVQEPTFRDGPFYARFGSVFLHDPSRAGRVSFWDGLYAGWWCDAPGYLFPEYHTTRRGLMQVTLLIAALPTAAILLGFAATLIRAVRRPDRLADVALASASVWMLAAMIAFSIRIPANGGVTPRYALSLVPVAAVFLLRGRELLSAHLRPARWLLDASALAVAALSLAVNWVQ